MTTATDSAPPAHQYTPPADKFIIEYARRHTAEVTAGMEDRFWSRVDKMVWAETGCWAWLGGHMNENPMWSDMPSGVHQANARRVAYMLTHRLPRIPKFGTLCQQQTRCLNPAHQVLGKVGVAQRALFAAPLPPPAELELPPALERLAAAQGFRSSGYEVPPQFQARKDTPGVQQVAGELGFPDGSHVRVEVVAPVESGGAWMRQRAELTAAKIGAFIRDHVTLMARMPGGGTVLAGAWGRAFGDDVEDAVARGLVYVETSRGSRA